MCHLCQRIFLNKSHSVERPAHKYTKREVRVIMDAPKKTKSKKSSSDKGKKAKKSGIRTKFLIESLRNDYYSLREENDRLRTLVSSNLPEEAADAILADCFDPSNAPKAKAASIDELASKLNTTGVVDEEDEEDDEDDDE